MLPKNLSPVGERVLVDVENLDETTTSTGIIVMNPNKNKSELSGTVLAVGAGARTKDGVLIPMTLTVGNVIMFPKTALQEVTINGKKYGVVKESDVYGVLD